MQEFMGDIWKKFSKFKKDVENFPIDSIFKKELENIQTEFEKDVVIM